MNQLDYLLEELKIQVTHLLSKTTQEQVLCKFMLWLLVDPQHGVMQYAENKRLIQNVADLYTEWLHGKKPSKKRWEKASAAAYSAAYAADAAADAAYSAYYSASAAAAAASTAAYYSASTAAYATDYSEARTEHYALMKRKMISLIVQEIAQTKPEEALDLFVSNDCGSIHEGLELIGGAQ